MAQARPGSTVAGRYRLDAPRPGDLPGAERWSATDTILARPVTVTLVSGPRSGAVLDAARRAALVVDPRLTRILDVGTADDDGYVVTAAVEGRSLASLAARAPLAADQARAVVGEAAAALEAARRRGVHHLALRPEVVLLTGAGRVVLEGLAVDGELLGAAGGSAHAMSRADTVGLVRVLYAALTGRWPAAGTAAAPAVPSFADWSARDGGASDGAAAVVSGLTAAPEHDGAPLPPVDLVATVPADLDTLCAVTLGPHDDGPHSPGELVRELEPWRAVRADEIFRAADAGRWPALPGQAADGATSSAPPTGSSTMSDDQHGTPTPDGAAPTPAGGTAGARGAGVAGAGVAGAGVAGAAGAAAATPVARQSVRSAFSGPQGPGTRRPGTPPPATPSGSAPTSLQPGQAPARQSARSTPATDPGAVTPPTGAEAVPTGAATSATAAAAVPPARSGSPAEPVAPAAPEAEAALPPAIPPRSEPAPPAIPPASARSSEHAGSTESTADTGSAAATGDAPEPTPSAGTTSPTGPDDAAHLAVAGITAVGDDDREQEPVEGPVDEAVAPAATPARRTSVFAARGTTAAAAAAPAAGPGPRTDPPADAGPDVTEPEPAEPVVAGAGDDGPGHPAWDLPFPAEQPAESLSQRRFDPTRWVLGAVAVAVVVGVVIAIGNVLSPFRSDDDAQSAPAPTASAPAAEAPAEEEQPAEGEGEAPATAPPVIAGITSIDPSDGDGEHEELVGALNDGDPATTWYTHTYNRPDFAGFKDAVGLAITLQAPATVSAITIDGLGTGGNVEVRSTDAANPTAGDVLAGGALATPQTVLTLAQPTETQSIVLWFTSLSQTPDGANKIELSTIAVS